MPHSLTFSLYINYTQTVFFFFLIMYYTQIVNAGKLNYFDHGGIASFLY